MAWGISRRLPGMAARRGATGFAGLLGLYLVAIPAAATPAPSPTPAPAPTPTATPVPTPPPTPVPTPVPTVRLATPVPTPVITPPPAPVVDFCGATPNPWGYTFCSGNYITNPPAGFCSVFNCIQNFPNGHGYVMECLDHTFSKSGGIQGSCSKHGGNNRPLYGP